MTSRSPREIAKWENFPYLAFDIESTGVNAHADRIVTATLVEFHPGRRPVASNWLVNPGDDIEIPAEATAVHGITTEHAREHGMKPDQALFEITGRIALWLGNRRPVVAFNAAYDLTMLEAENRRNTIPALADRLRAIGPVIDPMVIDRHADKYRKKICPCGCGAQDKTLGGCCIHYGVPLVAAHTSESDAASAVRLFKAIVRAKPEVFRGMTLGGLHEAQKGWRREQQNSLRAYFDKAGTPHDGMDPTWPVMNAPAGAAA